MTSARSTSGPTVTGIGIATPALDRDSIFHHPRFFDVEIEIARHLIDIHSETPRLARLKASHRKWLMTHALFALHLSRTPDDPLSGLTTMRFCELANQYDAASRNTAAAFLAEMIAYKFLRYVPDIPDRRIRVLEVTEIAEAAMESWFMGHMECLDRLDGGNRAALAAADPAVFRLAQPYAASYLCTHPGWAQPPESVLHFEGSELGGMVLHEIVSRMTTRTEVDGRIVAAPVGISEMSEKYAISVTNVKRMFNRAQEDGLLGWERPRRKGNLWLAPSFLDDYLGWQAEKFAGLDMAVRQALAVIHDAPQQECPEERVAAPGRGT